jgi:hypothetical protein
MAEEILNNTIKLILVALVVAAIVTGLVLIFKNKIFSFFKNLTGGDIKLFLGMIKCI